MKIKFKRFDKSLPLPSYKTAGAVAVDLCSRLEATIEPQKIGYIPMNVAVQIPEGFLILQIPRSSTHKLGLMAINSIGVIDTDYCGDNDEYLFAAYNFTDQPVTIEKGTRLVQLLLIKNEKMEIEEVDKMDAPDRGGIGSTGIK